jgi:hypothetical protein
MDGYEVNKMKTRIEIRDGKEREKYSIMCCVCDRKSWTTDRQTARLSEKGTLPWVCRTCSAEANKRSWWKRLLGR